MTQSIDQALVIQFSEMCHLLAQQMGSRLKGKVEEMPVVGNEFVYEALGSLRAIEVTTRHADTIGQDIMHTRRGGKMRNFVSTLYLDPFDNLQVLIDPARKYAEQVARSMMIQYDRLCLEAALGTVNTGRYLNVPLTASQDGVHQVVDNGTGLTYEKILEIKNTFYGNEVGVDYDEEMYLCITEKQLIDLMKENEVISRDFSNFGNASMAGPTVIDSGRVKSILGMNIILFGAGDNIADPLLKKTNNVRHCIAFTKSGICVGMNKDLSVKISDRPDKNHTIQIQASMFMDAIRTEGVRVQQVDCLES